MGGIGKALEKVCNTAVYGPSGECKGPVFRKLMLTGCMKRRADIKGGSNDSELVFGIVDSTRITGGVEDFRTRATLLVLFGSSASDANMSRGRFLRIVAS